MQDMASYFKYSYSWIDLILFTGSIADELIIFIEAEEETHSN